LIISQLRQSLPQNATTQADNVLVVHDDNFNWLQDGSVDLVLTDPPFNIARDTNFHTYEKNTINSFRFDADKGWDSYSSEVFRELLGKWTREFARVLRPGGNFAIFCADEYLSDLISALKSAGLKPRRTLTWRKPNAVPVNRKYMMMSACEYVVLGIKGSKGVFRSNIELEETSQLTGREIVAIADKAAAVAEQEIRRTLHALSHRPSVEEISELVKGVLTSSSSMTAKRSVNIYSEDGERAELCVPNYVSFNSKAGNRLHPTEKPVALLTYLTELLSSPGDLVLDPFAGSASMGEAAILSARSAILVERDIEYFDKGSERLKNLVTAKENRLL